MTDTQPVLIFVYLAESGLLNKLKDAVHKTFKPETYPCTLCDITYSPVAMRRQWKEYVRNLPIAVEFSYTDLMEQRFGRQDLTYPCACLYRNGQLETLISAEDMNRSETIDDLVKLVDAALKAHGVAPTEA